MPNIKSAKKRVLVSATKQAPNKADKTALKTILKKVDADTNADNVKVAVKAVDKAAAKGIIHKNAAARKKSQLANYSDTKASACIIMCRCSFFIPKCFLPYIRYQASSR